MNVSPRFTVFSLCIYTTLLPSAVPTDSLASSFANGLYDASFPHGLVPHSRFRVAPPVVSPRNPKVVLTCSSGVSSSSSPEDGKRILHLQPARTDTCKIALRGKLLGS